MATTGVHALAKGAILTLAVAIVGCAGGERSSAPLGRAAAPVGPAGKARCGTASPTPREVDAAEREVDRRLGVSGAARVRRSGASATVKVFWHIVLGSDGRGDLEARRIQEQMRVLNRGFEGTGFQFEIGWTERVTNDDWHDRCGVSAVERQMKRALYHSVPEAASPRVLHVYSCNADPYLGWAYFPSSVVDNATYFYDGIVIDYRVLPGGGLLFDDAGEPDGVLNYSGGNTLTHEAGHWFELYHTFDGACGRGDIVSDTPAQLTAQFYCVEQDTCAQAPGLDPQYNFMNYTDDDCINEYTDGQSDRMNAFFRAFRE